MEKNQIEEIVSKANRYLEIGRHKDSPKSLEKDEKIAQNWIYGISHLDFGVNDLVMPRTKPLKLKRAKNPNYSWNGSEKILIPKIYNKLESNLEDSAKNLKSAQNQPSTYEVLKNDPFFPEELLEETSRSSENNIYSSIDDLAQITAQSINEATRNAVKIEGYESPFFQKPKGEPRKMMNVWGKSTRK